MFFDLDGTLLNERSEIDDETLLSLDELKENRYMPIIATGRTVHEVGDVLDRAGINSIISMNGQHGIFNGKEIYSRKIDRDLIKKLKSRVLENQHQMAYYNIDTIKLTGVDRTTKECYRYLNGELPNIDRRYYRNSLVNMLLILSKDGDEEYKEEFPEFRFIRNNPYSMDVFSSKVSKAEGIKRFKEELNLSGLPTYAFGDSYNDLEMFEEVDYGVAMGNAVDDLKEKSTYVSSPNTKGGVREGLKYFNLI